MRFNQIIFLSVIFLLFGSPLKAQEDTTNTLINKEVKVVTTNDRVYEGILLKDDGREILVNTKTLGKMYFDKSRLKSLRPIDAPEPTVEKEIKEEENKVDSTQVSTDESEPKEEESTKDDTNDEIVPKDEYDYENYVSTKYLFTNNAMPLREGEAFVKFGIVGFEAQLPLTKNWSLGIMSSYIGAPAVLKTKYSIPLNEKSHLAFDLGYGTMAFATYFNVGGIRTGGGVASATYTIGDRNTNFSIKAGYSLIHQLRILQSVFNPQTNQVEVTSTEMDYSHVGFVTVGGLIKLSEKSTVVLNGGLGSFNDDFQLVAAGAASRFGPSPRHQFQIGGTFVYHSQLRLPFPVFNFSYTCVFRKLKHFKNKD